MVASLTLHSSLLIFSEHFSQLTHIKFTGPFKENSYSATEILWIEIAKGYLNRQVLHSGLKQRPGVIQ